MTYRELVQRQMNKELTSEQALTNATMGLSGEAGEVCDYVKKVLFHGKLMNKDVIIKELGDLRFYMEWLLMLVDSNIEEVEKLNKEKLLIRYPNGFNKQDAEKRVDTLTPPASVL